MRWITMMALIGLAMRWITMMALIGLVGWAPAGLLMIIGAVKMMRLKSYNWAVFASVLAFLPCSPANLLGIAVGIWSLVVLNRRDVREAFREGEIASAGGAGPVGGPTSRGSP